MKTRIFFAVYISVGLFCLATLAVVKFPYVAVRFIRCDMVSYGDMYELCKVGDFKIPIANVFDVAPRAPATPSYKARVIFVGDSFFHTFYGRIFERATGIPAFGLLLNKPRQSPVDRLQENGFKRNGTTKYLVFEHVERALQWKAVYPLPPATAIDAFNDTVKHLLIDVKALEYLVTNNDPMNWLIEVRNTFRFHTFRFISRETPVYSTDPPDLHYRQEVGGNRLVKDDEYVRRMADRIEAIGKDLERLYGLKMIFLAIPNKYTLTGYDYDKYHYNVQGESYDGFIPRLEEELGKRGVLYVDLYQPFMASKEGIFEPSHEHWTLKGMNIATKRLAALIRAEDEKAAPSTRR